MMDKKDPPDLMEGDKSIIELRGLLANYEDRLSGYANWAQEPHAARAHVPKPLFLVGDTLIDLRASALETCGVIEAPSIMDCKAPEEIDPFSFVYKVTNGVFRVHPRKNVATAAVIGPFAGPAPTGLFATAQTSHGAAPAVGFHISICTGEFDRDSVQGQLGAILDESRFLTVPPRHPGYLMSMAGPRPWPGSTESGASAADSAWGLLLATIADPPDEVSYAWAEFSDIIVFFSSDRGSEVRLLS